MKQGDRIQDGHQYGFFMIPNEMIDNHIENMGALGFVVYSVLMRHSNASSQCFPSYNTLIKKSSLSRPTIAKCIDHLVRKGYIRKLEIGHSKGHATTYQLLDLSLVPTSKPNELVKEVNQLTSLTSKGDLPVTSKGDLPQLVNVVNSNNTHLTKPINDNTHIRAHENFVNQNVGDRIKKQRQADQDKWSEAEIDCKALSKLPKFIEYVQTVYLPTVPDYRGKEIEITQAIGWIVKGHRDPARRDLVEIHFSAYEIWVGKQKSFSQPSDLDRPKVKKPNPLSWTAEQETWSESQWEEHLS